MSQMRSAISEASGCAKIIIILIIKARRYGRIGLETILTIPFYDTFFSLFLYFIFPQHATQYSTICLIVIIKILIFIRQVFSAHSLTGQLSRNFVYIFQRLIIKFSPSPDCCIGKKCNPVKMHFLLITFNVHSACLLQRLCTGVKLYPFNIVTTYCTRRFITPYLVQNNSNAYHKSCDNGYTFLRLHLIPHVFKPLLQYMCPQIMICTQKQVPDCSDTCICFFIQLY